MNEYISISLMNFLMNLTCINAPGGIVIFNNKEEHLMSKPNVNERLLDAPEKMFSCMPEWIEGEEERGGE